MDGLELSLLDFQHPGAAVALACLADGLGYKRFWLGEHHSTHQCTNPLLLGALLAGTTDRIRVGSGGVSLSYNRIAKVAEDARLIEFMLPGRFDLGVTRGLLEPGLISSVLLDGGSVPPDNAYRQRVLDLHALVTGRIGTGHPFSGMPLSLEKGPPLWVLGLSRESARMAAGLGAGFCFSVHHAPVGLDGPAILGEYRRHFVPSAEFPEPATIVVVQCTCGETDAEAHEIAQNLILFPGAEDRAICGGTAACAERLGALAARCGTREVMLLDFVQKDQSVRREMYSRIASALIRPAAAMEALV